MYIQIIFKAKWARKATLLEFDLMLESMFHSAKPYIKLETVTSGCLTFICQAPQWMMGALKMIVKSKQELLSSLKIVSVEIGGDHVTVDNEVSGLLIKNVPCRVLKVSPIVLALKHLIIYTYFLRA